MVAASIWEALAGREPGRPVGPADPDVYDAVLERLNPAKARPRLLDGIETAEFTSLRGAPYVMLRSPGDHPAYLRLDPAEVVMARLMDGSRTVATLVGEFARISGRLAPAQVMRVVADLAANRMLADLPVDAFRPVRSIGRRSVGQRLRHRLAAVLRGRPLVMFGMDRTVDVLYRAGGRLPFTRAGALLIAIVAIAGAVVFARRWIDGSEAVFVVGNSHLVGAIVLLGLNILCVAAHELGHALAARHAGRCVPRGGVMLYFGIPSVFVDTSDVWMAGRRARLLTAAAGTIAAIGLAGTLTLASVAVPSLSAAAFKLAFLWYLNALFNLNPLLALDGYHVLMDWLDIPNLRSRGLAFATARLRRRQVGWAGLSGEDRLYAMYGTAVVLWLVITLGLAVRLWRDRVDGLGAALWHDGIGGQAGILLILLLLIAPVAGAVIRWAGSAARSSWADRRHAAGDLPERLRILVGTTLGTLDPARLTEIARRSTWILPRAGAIVSMEGGAAVVASGVLEGSGAGDPTGVVRRRALPGDVIEPPEAGGEIGRWRAGRRVRLLALPGDTYVGPAGIRWPSPIRAGDARVGSMHLGGTSPALVWPAGAPAPADDGSTDRGLARRFRWLLLLLAGLALLAAAVAIPPGAPWAELADDQVLATVERGTATIERSGGSLTLRAGERVAVGVNEPITVGAAQQVTVGAAQVPPSDDVHVTLTFRGGASGWLCGGASATFMVLSTTGDDARTPTASIDVTAGIVVIDARSTSPQFADLDLIVEPADVATGDPRSEAGRGSVRFIEMIRPRAVDRHCESALDAIAEDPTSEPAVGPASSDRPATSPSSATPMPTPAATDGSSLSSPGAALSSPSSTPALDVEPGPAAAGSTSPASPTSRPSPTPAPRSTPTVAPTAKPTPAPTPAPTIAPGFTLACSPDLLQAPPGGATTSICTVTSIGSFASGVMLSCGGLGKVAGCTFTPPTVTPAAGKAASATLEVRVAAAANPGCYPFSVVGAGGSLSRTDRLVLDVPSSRGASC